MSGFSTRTFKGSRKPMLLDAWMVFSTRSANKKVCKTGVNPKNIFQRVKNSNECPILSHFIILASTSFFEQNNDQPHISLPSSLQAQSSDDEYKDDLEDEITFLDQEFLCELGKGNVEDDDDSSLPATPALTSDYTMDDSTFPETNGDDCENLELPNNPWHFFSKFDDKTVICSTNNDGITIFKKNAATLNKG